MPRIFGQRKFDLTQGNVSHARLLQNFFPPVCV
jgi:hypothetical protein